MRLADMHMLAWRHVGYLGVFCPRIVIVVNGQVIKSFPRKPPECKRRLSTGKDTALGSCCRLSAAAIHGRPECPETPSPRLEHLEAELAL
jgi:hypothetical protein